MSNNSNHNEFIEEKINYIDLTAQPCNNTTTNKKAKSADASNLVSLLHHLESNTLEFKANKTSVTIKNCNRIHITEGAKLSTYPSSYKTLQNRMMLDVPGTSLMTKIFNEWTGLLPTQMRNVIRAPPPQATRNNSLRLLNWYPNHLSQISVKFDLKTLKISKRTISSDLANLRASTAASVLKDLPYVLNQLIGSYIDGETIIKIPFRNLEQYFHLNVNEMELELNGLKVSQSQFFGTNAVSNNFIKSIVFEESVQ